jgi:hypothetical protein
MDSDRLRRLLIVVTVLAAIAVNGAANALPLNGQLTGEISDRFRVFVVPAGYVFAIWGVIYLFQLAFLARVVATTGRRDPLVRRLGLWPAVVATLNGAWIFLWHWEVFPLTPIAMLGILVSLVAIYLRADLASVARPGSGASARDRWLVQLPFSIYLGWITVATIANVAAVGAWADVPTLGLQPELIAAAVLAVGLTIAAAALVRTGDVAYGLVIVWAYAGIVAKEAPLATPYVPVVAAIAAVGMTLLLVAAIARRLPAGRAIGGAPA